MWIKICGTTNLDDARLAIDAGADALGFVFAKSPRRVTPEQVAAITRELPPSIEKYGVFVDADFDEIAATVRTAGLTGVQLHGAAPSSGPISAADLAGRLREHFGAGLGILRVLHYDTSPGDASLGDAKLGDTGFAAQLDGLRQCPAIDAVLVDSRSAQAMGGTGTRFDWQAARASLRAAREQLRIIVAGGLSPENVGAAIATLEPWGVDVVSGVEAAPGRKDPARVKQFITTARAAAELSGTARASESLARMENR
jgi:phosphoribosylanthranilate isomerase